MIGHTSVRNHVTLVEILELKGSFDEFAALSQVLVRRLEAEGIAELVGVHFYATPSDNEIGGLISFADYRQVVHHINMLSGWQEFKQLLSLVRLIDMRIYGPLTDESKAFLQTMNGISKQFATPLAGFVRWAEHAE